jgi:hypothetical protein
VNSNLNQAQFLSLLRAFTVDAGRKYDNVVSQAVHLQLLWFTKMDHHVLISHGGGGSYRDFYVELGHGLALLCQHFNYFQNNKLTMCPIELLLSLNQL